jgi:hypothetical protein
LADWYISSAAYAGLTAFVASHAYSIGDIVKPTAPAAGARWAFRCTTAGTSSTEPSWTSTNNGTNTSGGATFANVTGQSTYFWVAAAGDISSMIGQSSVARFAPGDRMFVSSDHSEAQSFSPTYLGSGNAGASSYTGSQVLCVNRAGSTPPAAADLTTGAVIACSTQIWFESAFPVYHYGVTYSFTGSSNGFKFNQSSKKSHFFDNCVLYLNNASATYIEAFGPAGIILNNTPIRFGATTQFIGNPDNSPLFIEWRATPSALPGSVPAILFAPTTTTPIVATLRGVDLSALTGTLLQNNSSGNSNCGCKLLLDSCRIASGLVRYGTSTIANTTDEVELVNCYDGTNIINERYQPSGVVTTERTITLSGGATDDVGVFSLKLVSNANVDKYVNPLNSFWMDVENTAVGSSKTATVEIISSLTLNNDDISLLLEYQGTTGSSVASFANTLPTNVLTTNAAVTASTATWNSSPATPQKQKLVITFTPLVAGRVRGQVRLGRASTTVYLNPLITIA